VPSHGLPKLEFLTRAVFPALWPAAPVAVLLLAIKPYVPHHLLMIGLASALGGGLYLLLFVLTGFDARRRDQYIRLLRDRWAAGLARLQKAA
jgi:hypothetical protein